jgi:hypothetical protein
MYEATYRHSTINIFKNIGLNVTKDEHGNCVQNTFRDNSCHNYIKFDTDVLPPKIQEQIIGKKCTILNEKNYTLKEQMTVSLDNTIKSLLKTLNKQKYEL